LNKLRGNFPACWARGYEWEHNYRSCPADVAKDGDDNWNAWHREAFEFPEGWRWFCFMPQVNHHLLVLTMTFQPGANCPHGGWHYFVEGRQRNCKDDLLKPALYAFLTASKVDNLHVSQCRVQARRGGAVGWGRPHRLSVVVQPAVRGRRAVPEGSPILAHLQAEARRMPSRISTGVFVVFSC
jgi:hypothetical protein